MRGVRSEFSTTPSRRDPAMSDQFYGNDVEVRPGRHIIIDGWGPVGQTIRADEVGFATYRIPTASGGPVQSLACEVTLTGRTLQRKMGSYYAKVQVLFKGDGEPDVATSGWMFI